MGVVVQELVPADVAGVLFTRNPVTGAAERVIEASWGLGEAVVAGLVVPDRYRLDVRGRVLETGDGGEGRGGAAPARRRPQRDRGRRRGRCTPPAWTTRSSPRCTPSRRPATRVYGTRDHDIEFAFHAGAVFLLQRRPITGGVRTPVRGPARGSPALAAALLASSLDAAQLHDDRGRTAGDRP